MVKSTNATTGLGGNAYYDVAINEHSVFYSADEGDNNWGYDKSKAEDQRINTNLRKTTLTVAGAADVLFDNNVIAEGDYCNFVGHNDKVDYARVNVDSGTARSNSKSSKRPAMPPS